MRPSSGSVGGRRAHPSGGCTPVEGRGACPSGGSTPVGGRPPAGSADSIFVLKSRCFGKWGDLTIVLTDEFMTRRKSLCTNLRIWNLRYWPMNFCARHSPHIVFMSFFCKKSKSRFISHCCQRNLVYKMCQFHCNCIISHCLHRLAFFLKSAHHCICCIILMATSPFILLP